MKKLFIVILFSILSSSLFAQQTPFYNFRLGLTAHPTFGWLKPENGKADGLSLGFSYGLIGDFDFAENYSFSTGLTVTTINGKSTEINPSSYHPVGNTNILAYNLKYKLQYIEVPLTLKLKTGQIGEQRYYGQFGLSNDFNIGAKQDVSQGGQTIADNTDIKKITNFYRAGLILRAGTEFAIDNHTMLTLGLTYNNGFTDISSDNNRTIRSHYIGLNFGVFF